MEGRKLQLAGGSTYVVSLPKKWVINAGLKTGDTLFLDTETDGSVSVRQRATDKPALRKKVFEEKGEEPREHLLRKFMGAYISGFALIEVRFTHDRGPFVRRVAREFCHLVVGPEVIEETRNGLVIRDLSNPAELSPEKCLRRMHLIVRAMLEDAILSLKSSRAALAHDVALRDQDVDRLYWMVSKHYHLAHSLPSGSSNGAFAQEVSNHPLVAKVLQRIGDHAARIAGTFPILAEKKVLDAMILQELEEANASAVAILDKSFSALISEDIDLANEAIDDRAQHQMLLDSLRHRDATRKGEELLALGTVVDSIGRTANYAADIAEMAIDLAVLVAPTGA